jgi:hypothetical protein
LTGRAFMEERREIPHGAFVWVTWEVVWRRMSGFDSLDFEAMAQMERTDLVGYTPLRLVPEEHPLPNQ